MLRFFAACRAPQLSLRALSSVANVDVVDAAERIARGAVYVDCRAESEFVSGAVAGAINCPFPHNDAGGVTNEAFLDDVAQVVQRSDSILVGCRSGVRSLMAAEVLLSDDYVDVSNVGGGIMAWSDAALPMVLPE